MPLTELQTLLERPKVLQEAIFTRLFEQAEIAMFSPQERLSYEESLKDYRDIYSVMKTQFEKGQAEGRAEGRAEGITKVAYSLNQWDYLHLR